MIWYLQIAGSAPQPFATYGLGGLRRQIRSQRAGIFTFTAEGVPCDSDSLAPEGTLCAVYSDSIPFFSGRLYRIPRGGSGRAASVAYKLLDAWHDFEKNVFQQQWNVIVGLDESGVPTTAAQYRSECILGMDISGNALNSGDVIGEIVAYAISVGANCQIGAIDVSAPVPFDEITDLPCSECIKKMLRLTPDAVTWLDYSTTPPTFNVTRRGNCTAISLPFTGLAEEVNITPLPDLLAPSVVIRYLQENQTDGIPSVSVIIDDWPEGSTGEEYGALVCTTRLAGSNSTYQKQPVTVIPIPPDATASNAVSFLYANVGWLRAFSKDRITVNSLSTLVLDDNGNPTGASLSATPNQIQTGTVAPWMNVQSATVQVTASISYQYPDPQDSESTLALANFGPDDGSLDGWDNKVQMVFTVTGTNAVSQTYTQLASYEQPEPVPSGLAQEIYSSLSLLQYEGTYETVTTEITQWRLGTVLNLAGGRPEWATMNALLQEIEDDLDNGRTTLRFGPAAHLTLQDLMEHLRANRSRTTSRHIKERQSGQPSGNGEVDGPIQGPGTNYTPAPTPTHYPWIDFIDLQDDEDGNPVTWEALLGYGESSFAGPDGIDNSGPLESLEISAGNDGSPWTGPDRDASDLTNVFSMISGDQTPHNDRLWIGRTDGGDGGSLLARPFDPSLYLSQNLNPEDDAAGDPFIHISLADMSIQIQDEDGANISLDLTDDPLLALTNSAAGASAYFSCSGLDLNDGAGNSVALNGDGLSIGSSEGGSIDLGYSEFSISDSYGNSMEMEIDGSSFAMTSGSDGASFYLSADALSIQDNAGSGVNLSTDGELYIYDDVTGDSMTLSLVTGISFDLGNETASSFTFSVGAEGPVWNGNGYLFSAQTVQFVDWAGNHLEMKAWCTTPG